MNNKVMYTLAQMMGKSSSKYIKFKDPEVERVLIANGVGDGVGITKEQLAAVTDIGTWFKGNTTIEYFNEFEQFTGITDFKFNIFNDTTNLKEITMPNKNIEGIYHMFYNSGVETVIFPKNFKSISSEMFQFCKRLKNVTFNCDDWHFKEFNHPKGYQFYNCSSLIEFDLRKCTSNYIPQYCFCGCSNLRNVIFPIDGRIKEINIRAFNDCAFEGIVTLPNGLNKISDYPFVGCSKMTGLIIPSSVTTIGSGIVTVTGCKTLTIPENVTTMADNCLENLQKVKMTCKQVPTLGGTRGTSAQLYVVDELYDSYKIANNWSVFYNAGRLHRISEWID